jgi:predicted methyltransferase
VNPRSHDGRALCAATLIAVLQLGGCKPEGRTTPAGEHYDDKAAALASFEEPDRDKWAMPARVIEVLKIEPSMDIADIGAGSGYFTRRLATAAPAGTTYAIDVDADFKTYIEDHRAQWQTPNIVTRLAVYEHPLLPVGSVDLVFISNTYSFLQDRDGYFTAVLKALRPHGRLAVIDWRVDAECPRALECPKPNQRLAQSVAIEELTQVGFTVLEDHDFLAYQYFMILGRREDVAATPGPTPTPTPSPAPSEPSSTAEPTP